MQRCILSLCLLLVVFSIASAQTAQDTQMVEYAKPWDKGINICAYYAPGVLDYKLCPYCLPWKQDYAKANMKFKYDCCPGFKRCPRFENNCVERERTYKLIPGILRDHKLNKFADYITSKKKGAGYKPVDKLESANPRNPPYTVIAPYSSKVVDKGEINYPDYKGQKNHPILFHVTKGRTYLRDLRNGMLLQSEYNGHKLKVTKYSNGLVCIECRELVEPDHEARNGVVHYFAGMMTPHVTDKLKRSTVMELLQNHPSTTEFASSIPEDVRKLLSADKNCLWFTVFAPNNEMWRPIKAADPEKAKQIARNHILRRGMYCAAAIIAKVDQLGPTFADEYLTADIDKNGKRMVRSNGAPGGAWANIDKPDLMAGNGVVHLINNVLRPRRNMPLQAALNNDRNYGNPDWIKYMQKCDLRMQPGKKYAVLIPKNEAFDWWKNYKRFQKYYQRWQTDEAFRCRLIRFHIFEITGDKATNLEYLWLQQEGYRTNNVDRLWHVDYFMKMYYGSLLYFHYSPVDMFRSYQYQDGSIYYINRVNMIPEQNIIQILPTRKDFATTFQLTKLAKMHPEVFVKNRPLNLYLVVRNGGYTPALKKSLTAFPINAKNFLLLHWVPLYLWGGDIGYFEFGTRHRFMSGLNVELIFDREKDGVMYIGYEGLARNMWARVVEWNIYAIDGMIWVLDKPLPCPGKKCAKKMLEIEVWKVLSFACWESMRVRRGAKARDMEPWLDKVNGDQCYTNREEPKSEKSEHSGRRRR